MRAYLATTGLLFALLTVLHVVRVFDEWGHASTDHGFMTQMLGLSALTAVLAVWAFKLFRAAPRA